MNKIIQYLREVKNEMRKVIWPSRKETIKMTVIVILFSLLVSFFLGAVDLGLIKLIEMSLKK
ncbi:MAG: preprotein translocase subunit SecE [bacterium]|nr:preprotein translocase subunit SecE [bacterium]